MSEKEVVETNQPINLLSAKRQLNLSVTYSKGKGRLKGAKITQ